MKVCAGISIGKCVRVLCLFERAMSGAGVGLGGSRAIIWEALKSRWVKAPHFSALGRPLFQ